MVLSIAVSMEIFFLCVSILLFIIVLRLSYNYKQNTHVDHI